MGQPSTNISCDDPLYHSPCYSPVYTVSTKISSSVTTYFDVSEVAKLTSLLSVGSSLYSIIIYKTESILGSLRLGCQCENVNIPCLAADVL